jgi:hypothetical protein
LGSRHCPAVEPSLKPHWPLARLLIAARVLGQLPLMQLARFSQVNPVTVSNSVASSPGKAAVPPGPVLAA